LLPDMGLELFDIQFRQEGHGWVLRVFIDTPAGASGGVTLDQCSDVSRELGQYLDVEDCIAHAYHLEVSSPGLDRPLRSLQDFARFQGEVCKVRLHHPLAGEKVHIGRIISVDGAEITLETAGGSLQIEWEKVNKARLFLQ
ncbi:MAG: ribosome maturation factor RimP, partial [Desulfobacterales bacterium]